MLLIFFNHFMLFVNCFGDKTYIRFVEHFVIFLEISGVPCMPLYTESYIRYVKVWQK